MKTILSILFCCYLLASTATAQTAPPNYQYIPMVVENAHWKIGQEIRYNGVFYGTNYYHRILRGDTTIAGVTYKKLYNCPYLIAGLREDTATHKVYVYPFNTLYYAHGTEYPIGQENLFIDFNQDTAPQVDVPWLGPDSIDRTTYLLYENRIGTIRRTLIYGNYCNLSTIEGIGFGNGGPILDTYCHALGCQSCYETHSYVAFYNIISPTQNCSTFVDTENKQSPSSNLGSIKVFPNPTTGTFYIQNLPPQANLTLHDALGRSVVFIQKENEINIQHLPNGVYCCIINEQNKASHTFKIIKTE